MNRLQIVKWELTLRLRDYKWFRNLMDRKKFHIITKLTPNRRGAGMIRDGP